MEFSQEQIASNNTDRTNDASSGQENVTNEVTVPGLTAWNTFCCVAGGHFFSDRKETGYFQELKSISANHGSMLKDNQVILLEKDCQINGSKKSSVIFIGINSQTISWRPTSELSNVEEEKKRNFIDSLHTNIQNEINNPDSRKKLFNNNIYCLAKYLMPSFQIFPFGLSLITFTDIHLTEEEWKNLIETAIEKYGKTAMDEMLSIVNN